VLCFFLVGYLQSNVYGALTKPSIWDILAIGVPIILGFEGVVLAIWAWIDDDRLYELERKTQDIPLPDEQNPES
jgi:hypothetical protein